MLIVILFFLIQINFLNYVPLFKVIPNAGIILICALGIVSGSEVGGACGGFYGILCDLFFGKTLGIYFMLYFLIGISAGYFKDLISKDNKLSLGLMVALSTFLFEIFLCIISHFLYGYEINLKYLLRVIIFEELYNMFITYVVFWSLISWGEAINRSKDSYYLLH